MQPKKSTALAIGLPVVIALLYGIVFFSPWSPISSPPKPLNGQESAKLWEQCKALFRQGKYQEALPSALKLHESYPGSHIYIEMVAEIYDHLGRYDQEADYWEQYFDRAPNPVTACPQIGQAYWKQGKGKEAVGAFERCLAQDPEDSDSIFFLAHALEMTDQAVRAMELYQRGVKIAPQYSDLQLGLARMLLRQDQAAEAKRIALQVLDKSPQNVDALLVAGRAYQREGDLARARQYLQKGVQLSDENLDFHIALAQLNEEEKNFPEAVREYNRFLQDRPDDSAIRARRDALMVQH